MKHRNRLSRPQRVILYLVSLGLVISGALWLCVHYLNWPAASRAALEGLPSPWQPWLMRIHGLCMMVMLFMVGRLSGTHVMKGWRLHLKRTSGVAMLSLLAGLAVSGYALYYLVNDDWRDLVGGVHASLGAVWALTLCLHQRRADQSSL